MLDIQEYLLMFFLFNLMNNYIITPVILNFFPNEFYGTTFPQILLRENLIPLTLHEVSESVQDLKKIKQHLQNIRKYVYFLLYPGTIAFCALRYFNNQQRDAELHAFHLAFNLFNNLTDYLFQHYLEHKKRSIMLRGNQSLNSISRATGLPNWTKVKTNTKAYYFRLNIFRRDTKKESRFEGIPISRLIKELVSVLCKYEHINILAYDKYAITLSFSKFLSEIDVNEINLYFLNRLSSIKNKYILINQLNNLFSSLKLKFEIQEINQDIFSTKFDFIIPLDNISNFFKGELTKQLNTFFDDTCSIQFANNSLIIIQAAVIEPSRYEAGLNLLKDWLTSYQHSFPQLKSKVTQALSEQTSHDIFFFTRKRKRPANPIIPLLNLADPSIRSENYKWNSGTYSNDQENTVVKVREGHNLFSVFQLKPEDFNHCPKRSL